jgi:hypothetical protein
MRSIGSADRLIIGCADYCQSPGKLPGHIGQLDPETAADHESRKDGPIAPVFRSEFSANARNGDCTYVALLWKDG